MKRFLIALVFGVSCCSADAANVTVTTGFEGPPNPSNTAPFTVGTSPDALLIQAGAAQRVDQLQFYHSGFYSWHISPGDSPATAVFETDASALSFWVRTTDSSITSRIRVFDENGVAILSRETPDAFMQISVVRATGQTLIRSFEITNDGGSGILFEDVVVDDLSFTTAAEVPVQAATDLKCKGCVGFGDLGKNSVTATKIRKGSVGTAKIRRGAVTENRFADEAVTLDKLAPEVAATLPDMEDCVSANGLIWCFDNNTCGQACNDVCASKGLSSTLRLQPIADNTVWFEAQDTVQECQAISAAFGISQAVVEPLPNSVFACLEDQQGVHTVGGGLIPPLLCSTDSICPSILRTQMAQLGVACGPGSRRAICPCELAGLSPGSVQVPDN